MILLLRHGQTDWNVEPTRCQGWTDVPLNDVGRAQARERGYALRGRGIELIVTSHLARARETAEIARARLVADTPGAAPIQLVIDPRLAETDRGTWESRAFAEIMAGEPEAWRHYRERPDTFRFPGGESLVEQQRRVLAGLRDAALDGRRALLVSHGGSIRLVRCFLAGTSIAALHQDAVSIGAVVEAPVEGLVQRIDEFLQGNP